MGAVHLHVHTFYSLLDGSGSPTQFANRAAELGQKALAITDHGVMYGALAHYKACHKANIKPIIGCEFYVTPNHKIKDKAALAELPYDNSHLIVLARNNEGYENIRRLLAISALDGFYYKPRIDFDLLKQYNKGIIVLSACLAGEVSRLILRAEWDKLRQLTELYASTFDSYCLEIQANRIPEQHIVNQHILELGNKLGIPVVATCDSHYVLESDHKAHQNFTILGAQKQDSTVDVYADTWLKTEQEMLQLGIPQHAIDNTETIADMCEVTIETGKFHLPTFQIPEKDLTLDEYLSKMCYDNLFDYSIEKEIDIDTYAKRLEYELEVIKNKGLSGYFLIVQDFVNESKRNGIWVGPGRGSAAGSLVSFIIGITSVDPIEHGLLFERFINPERPSMPDIDVDFEDARRGEVIDFISRKYGADKTCQVITFGNLLSRMALKDAAHILNMDFDVINALTKKIPVIEGRPYTIQESIDNIPEIAKAEKDYPELFGLARHFEGVPRQVGKHAAGIVITPDELVKYIPIGRGRDGEVTSQFSKDELEDLGLLKFDLLGLKTLTVMHNACDLIYQQGKQVPDLRTIPLDDKDTLKLIASGNTIGVFQLESEGMQKIFKSLDHVTFNAIVAGVSLYRPGPMDLIPSYIKAFNGTLEVNYPVPELKPILEETFGVILYQEQTMKIATVLAGYTPGQADLLRKAIGKKKKEVMEAEINKLVNGSNEDNIKGMVANGIPREVAENIASTIKKFAGYGFNKSHATCYALIAYQTAYLKAHYPLEFICAQLTTSLGNVEKLQRYANEAKRMGIKFLPPSINISQKGFSIEEDSIRFALSGIKGIGPNVVDLIVRERPFTNIEDLLDRIPKRQLNKKALKALSYSGALDSISNLNRAQIYQRVMLLRDDNEDLTEEVSKFSRTVSMEQESELLGMFVSDHPLAKIAKPVRLDLLEPGDSENVWAILHLVRKAKTGAGDPMAFLSIETLEGNITVAMFSKALTKYEDKLVPASIVKLTIFKSRAGLSVTKVQPSKKPL